MTVTARVTRRTVRGLAAALAAVATQSQAGYTVFYDEASYLAAVGATRAYTDFAGSPAAVVPGSMFLPEVIFGSCPSPSSVAGCATSVLHNDDGITDIGNGVAANGVGSLAWRFTLPDVHAFGFSYGSGAIVALNFVDPVTLDLQSVPTPGASGFIGILSTQAVYGAIAANAVFPNQIGLDRYFLFDFRINDIAVVPAPGTLALAGLALIAAAGLSRRGS